MFYAFKWKLLQGISQHCYIQSVSLESAPIHSRLLLFSDMSLSVCLFSLARFFFLILSSTALIAGIGLMPGSQDYNALPGKKKKHKIKTCPKLTKIEDLNWVAISYQLLQVSWNFIWNDQKCKIHFVYLLTVLNGVLSLRSWTCFMSPHCHNTRFSGRYTPLIMCC